jgi:hypothetical protein
MMADWINRDIIFVSQPYGFVKTVIIHPLSMELYVFRKTSLAPRRGLYDSRLAIAVLIHGGFFCAEDRSVSCIAQRLGFEVEQSDFIAQADQPHRANVASEDTDIVPASSSASAAQFVASEQIVESEQDPNRDNCLVLRNIRLRKKVKQLRRTKKRQAAEIQQLKQELAMVIAGHTYNKRPETKGSHLTDTGEYRVALKRVLDACSCFCLTRC